MSARISDNDVQYALDLVGNICNQAGPGLPGSLKERERAEIIRTELETHLGKENVSTEDFSLAPDAFPSAMPVGCMLMLIAALLNILAGHASTGARLAAAVSSVMLILLAQFVIIFEFLFFYEFIDRFFRKKNSVNVIGTLRKPGAVNIGKLLIISGHHDSARENWWFRIFGYAFYFPLVTVVLGINVVMVMSIIQLAGVTGAVPGMITFGTISWKLMIYPVLPTFLFSLLFSGSKKNGGKVPGAVDNLSACASLTAMCRFLAEHPSCIPEDTEIRFITFGSEEAGLRGSRRYVSRHLEDLKRMDCRVLNLETISHPEISILTSDRNRLVKNSPLMVKTVAAAAERAGVPYKIKPFPFGASDSASFSKAGLMAATILPFSIPRQLVAFYHQRCDRPEVLTREPLSNVLKLTLEWIRNGGE